MTVSHQQVLFADFSDARTEIGPAIDGCKLAHHSAASNFDKRLFTFEFDCLRRCAHRCILKYLTVRSNGHIAIHNDMGADNRSGSNGNVISDNGIGTDIDISVDFSFRINNGSRMNHAVSPNDAISSASAANCPSTVALPDILATFDLNFKILASNMI